MVSTERVTVDGLERGTARLWGGGGRRGEHMHAGGRVTAATVTSAVWRGWCAASSLDNQWPSESSEVIRGHQWSSVVISAARLMRCFQSVLLQPRLPICLLSRCNLVASSVHLLMTALPTGFVIVRRLPLQRPFIRTQTYSDAIQS